MPRTRSAPQGICRPSAVEVLCEEAPARIADLVALGVEFDEGSVVRAGTRCAGWCMQAGRRCKAISEVLAAA